jgi:hypothetical protein
MEMRGEREMRGKERGDGDEGRWREMRGEGDDGHHCKLFRGALFADVLLCHDDELEGRRIAFILYLVPEWGEEDGGKAYIGRVRAGSRVTTPLPIIEQMGHHM